ncbi:GNAT family N-acetyltransferase [Streptomyces bathyalis]|uniref:GNAT family N-acetyltransferase n=1 Tax=Streptomyces bathyalis TaxID=2710756 RepID=A0A7T1T9I2_9ACTN|nr:GNAT family N-acetyltransferase [Streptomyces bathyalis]QPP08887.1 GNAT family N-acetyltransferase [Streptomyces bathyalis]
MIELEVLTPDDWKTWRTLRHAALADAPYAFKSRLADWQGDGDREERWRDLLGIAGSYNLVAALGGKPVGMARGVPGTETGAAWLHSMWVAGSGRGYGVGDRLVRAVELWAVRSGAGLLSLAVMPSNRPAIALYRRHGFEETGLPGAPLPDGQHELVMAKLLGPSGT